VVHPELGCGGLADDDRACPAEYGNGSRVGHRLAAAKRVAAVFGRHIVGVEHVLHADGEAVQRTERPPCRPLPVCQSCLLQRPFRIEEGPGPDLRLAGSDPVKACPHQVMGADLSLSELGGHGVGCHPVRPASRHYGQGTRSRQLAAEQYVARTPCRHRIGAARPQPESAAERKAIAAGTVAIRS
jgi:hypothetical protein